MPHAMSAPVMTQARQLLLVGCSQARHLESRVHAQMVKAANIISSASLLSYKPLPCALPCSCVW